MRPRLFVKLLWFVILVAITAFINRPVEAAGSAHSSSSDKILQFTSGGHILGFGAEGVYIASGSHALRVQFVNAHKSNPVSDGPSSHGVPGDTQRTAPLSRVTYANLWDGVTLTYDAPGGAVVRSTYRIDPQASPENIRLRYNAPVSVESDGSLRISFHTGAMNESAPQAWQERGGKRVPTQIAFSQRGRDEIGFVVGEYDRSEPLFIDPTLTWTTFLGGSGADEGWAVAVDGSGNVYVAGQSYASWGSPVRAYGGGNYDAFAAKLDSSGNLIWNTFLGGSGDDEATGVAVDGSGNVYVSGLSSASWGSPVRAYGGSYDAFAAKLNSSGNLIWNTFLGGSGDDGGTAMALDGSGNAYVAGVSSASWGSPVRAYSSGNYDAFAAKLDSSGNLIWNTFLGGIGADEAAGVAVDGSGNAYVAGYSAASWGSPARAFSGNYDAFAAKLDSSGNLIWNTFLGGSGTAVGNAVAVDGSGNVYVSGLSSASWGSPVLAYGGGVYDAFAVKLGSSGNLIWNTFLGGSGDDEAWGVAVDGSGNVYVSGLSSASWGSPVRAYGGSYDAFAAKLGSSGNLIWNTFLGGSGDDYGYGVAVDGSGNVYVSGLSSASWGSPVRAYSSGYDAFVAKISDAPVIAPPLSLPGNGGITETSLGQGSLVTAYGQITTTTATQPGALANFGYTQNGILTTEAGVAASAPATAARVFVDYSTANGTDSGVAVLNPSNNSITINVQLNNAQGVVTTCPSQTVPADGHLAMFASQLCQGVISNPFLGTLTLSSSTAFAATNLMLGTNAHGEPLYNSLPVANPPLSPAGSNLYFSQFVDGGGYSTALLLMNLTGTTIAGTVSFFDDSGHPVTMNFGSPIGAASTLNYSIPGNGMQKYTTTGSTPGTPLHVGFVVVTSTSGTLPSGAVIFSRYNGAGGLASVAGVLNSPVTTYSRMYVEKSSSPLVRSTGVAIVDPNSSAATVQLSLTSLDGSFTASNTITVAANNHLAGFIDQSTIMGATAASIPANFQGILTLSSNVPIAPVTLRLTSNQRGEDLYSTMPVTDLNHPPAGPLYLPQIVDGGGYTTQIILVNTGSSAGTITINFFNDAGSQVQIPFSYEAVQKIAGGALQSLALKSDGTVWAWGNNQYGQLGNGATTDSSVPVPVQGLTNVVSIAAGVHSLALRSDGTVWAWGYNYDGELGNGTLTNSNVPVEVQGLTNAVAIAAGYYHSLAVRSDGTVWAWGLNGNGQLGNGTTTNSSVPVKVQGLMNIVAVGAGEHHSFAIKSDGTVWAWGDNDLGQLGNATTTSSSGPVEVQGLTNAISVAGGWNHSFALRSDDTVWAWGQNANGELGNGTATNSSVPVMVQGLTNAIAIASGWDHCMALRNDGTLWAWGLNDNGQLGNGATTNSIVPVEVQGLTNVVTIAGGGFHSLAVRGDGTVWAWGDNERGQLGNGTTTNSSVPVQVHGF
jgi:alpha-tubulin suppressor-like RCC1 family protein